MKKHSDGIGIHTPRSRNAWRRWLERNHESERSVWLVYKKGPGLKRNITYPEAVEEALCFGWIDSKPKKLNDSITIQYFSKRNPKSSWSSLNKSRISKLLKEKLMHPAGIRMVNLAKRTGTWKALDEVEALVMPDDLALAFKRNPAAFARYDALSKSKKNAFLMWIQNAKRPETRKRRIQEVVKLAAFS